MPLRKLSGPEAIARFRQNPYNTWPTGKTSDDNRLTPICKPAFIPSFRLAPGEKVFTIGSCFARNIEKALSVRGFDVVTGRLNWPDKSIDTLGNVVLNNYGVASIANELRWALEPSTPFDPNHHIVEMAPGQFVDLHVAMGHGVSRDMALARRSAITEVTRRVTECRVVIMTLGLSELWLDLFSGSYLNRAPAPGVVAKFPDRFEVHLLSFEETMATMREALELLRKYCRADQHILLTVSPVPLSATFTGDDVIVTNSYSKAILRGVAEQACSEFDNVDYFPSFESVTLSDNAVAWEDDQRHVRQDVITTNVERMIDAYRRDAAVLDDRSIKAALRVASQAIQDQDFDAAMMALEPVSGAIELDAAFATTYAEVCLRLRRIEDARRAVERMPKEASNWRSALVKASINLAAGNAERAVAGFAAVAEGASGRAQALRGLVESYVELERYDDALNAARKWMKDSGRSVEPFRRIVAIHIKRGHARAAESAFKLGFERCGSSPMFALDYAEFLIAQRRASEASHALDSSELVTAAHYRRAIELRAILPSE